MSVNLDPKIINQEALRKERRKKMLIYAALPAIICVVAGTFFLRPSITVAFVKAGVNSGRAEGVIGIANLQKTANAIEPYIAYYNSGTAYLASNKAQEAERDLRKSLKQNPPADKVCQVRVNLSYSIELRADKEQSAYLYNMAQGVLLEDNCASQQEDLTPRDKMAQAASKRIDAKIRQLNSQTSVEAPDINGERQITDEEVRNYKNDLLDGYTYRDSSRELLRRTIIQHQNGSQSGLLPESTW
jgi:hypothetical protein